MKRKFAFLFSLLMVVSLILSGCGDRRVANIAQGFELKENCFAVEVGQSLSTNPLDYINLLKGDAKDIVLNFDNIDIGKTGTYSASVRDNENELYFIVNVVDDIDTYNTLVLSEVISGESDTLCDINIYSPEDGKLTLAWNKVTGATGYEIWQGPTSDGPFFQTQIINDVNNTTTTYSWLSTYNTYYFKVRPIMGENTYGDFSIVVGQLANVSSNQSIVVSDEEVEDTTPIVDDSQNNNVENSNENSEVREEVIPTPTPTPTPTPDPTPIVTPIPTPEPTPTLEPSSRDENEDKVENNNSQDIITLPQTDDVVDENDNQEDNERIVDTPTVPEKENGDDADISNDDNGVNENTNEEIETHNEDVVSVSGAISLDVQVGDAHTAQLSWNQIDGVNGYRVYLSVGGGNFEQTLTLFGSDRTNTSLTYLASREYKFRVVGFVDGVNGREEVVVSNDASVDFTNIPFNLSDANNGSSANVSNETSTTKPNNSSSTVSQQPTSTPTSSNTSNSMVSVDVGDVLSIINEERTSNGAGEVTSSPLLTAIAQERANHMAQNGYFSHYYNGVVELSRLRDVFGYPNTKYIGENISKVTYGRGDVTTLVTNGWMNSSGHHENMLNSRWTRTGIAYAVSSDGIVYTVQVFGE